MSNIFRIISAAARSPCTGFFTTRNIHRICCCPSCPPPRARKSLTGWYPYNTVQLYRIENWDEIIPAYKEIGGPMIFRHQLLDGRLSRIASVAILTALNVIVIAGNGARAQSTASDQLAEIVVTAEKRSENVQRVPI